MIVGLRSSAALAKVLDGDSTLTLYLKRAFRMATSRGSQPMIPEEWTRLELLADLDTLKRECAKQRQNRE